MQVTDLSGGNRKRLQVAREFLRIRPIMILDEPTAGLDPIIRNVILNDIQRMVREQNILVLYTSHYLGEIEKMADKLLVLKESRVQFWGDSADFVRRVSDQIKVSVIFEKEVPEGLALESFGRHEIHPPNLLVLYTSNSFNNISRLTDEIAAGYPTARLLIEPITLEQAFVDFSRR